MHYSAGTHALLLAGRPNMARESSSRYTIPRKLGAGAGTPAGPGNRLSPSTARDLSDFRFLGVVGCSADSRAHTWACEKFHVLARHVFGGTGDRG